MKSKGGEVGVDVVKVDMKVKEEGAGGGARWREVIGCGRKEGKGW